MGEEFRVSRGEVRLDAPAKFKAVRTDDGRLHCEGAFARDGILEYRRADGTVVRELRRPEVNGDPRTLETFKFLPMTVEHPPTGLLNSKTYKSFAVGMSDSSVKYDSEFGGIVGNCSLFDADAIGYVDRGEKVQLSAGYTCDIKPGKGVWNGQPYDQEQINVKANHLALTAKGRAGADVGLRMDSADSDAGIGIAIGGENSIEKDSLRMAKVRLDSVEYDAIPEAFASAIGVKLRELEDRARRLDALESKEQTSAQEVQRLRESLDLLQGRLDGYEVVVGNADLVLSNLGYERNDDGIYEEIEDYNDEYYNDEYYDDEDEEYYDDDDDDEYYDDEDEEYYDDDDDDYYDDDDDDYYDDDDDDFFEDEEHMDSVDDRMEAWGEAEELLPGIMEAHYDPELTANDIRRIVVNYVDPDLHAGARTDSYIDGAYAGIVDSYYEDDDDGGGDYRYDSLNSLISSQGGYHNAGGADDGLMPWEAEMMDNFRSPLTMSKNLGRN